MNKLVDFGQNFDFKINKGSWKKLTMSARLRAGRR